MSKRFVLLFAILAASARFSPAAPAQPAQPAQPMAKNVVIMISDGAGFNTWNAASMYQGRFGKQVYDGPGWVKYACTTYPLSRATKPTGAGVQVPALIYDAIKAWDGAALPVRAGTLPFAGYQYLKNTCVDSAASATAMATGVKTYDNAINWTDLNQPLAGRTIAEIAKKQGKAAGVVTTVQWSHATPAVMGGAHNVSRSNYAAIAGEMLDAPVLDVIMGAGHPDFDNGGKAATGKKDYQYVGGQAVWEQLRAGKHPRGWTLIEKKADFEALTRGATPAKVLGTAQAGSTLQFKRGPKRPDASDAPGAPPLPVAKPFSFPMNANVPSLETMTKAALNCLDDNPNGFYLCVEGGAVDWANHAKQPERMIEEQIDFLRAVEAVADWVNTRGNWNETLLILTADHETGLLWGEKSDRIAFDPMVDRGKGNQPGLRHNTTSHSNSLVPLYAHGPGSERFAPLVRGTDRRAATKYGISGQYVDDADIFTVMAAVPRAGRAAGLPATGLSWDNDAGVVWRTPWGVVSLDRHAQARGPVVKFLPGGEQRLTQAVVGEASPERLQLTYRVMAPGGIALDIVRDIQVKAAASGLAAVETFTLRPSKPLAVDVQIERVLALPAASAAGLRVTCPLKNGWAKSVPLAAEAVLAEYRLGNLLTGTETPSLAIPLLQVDCPERWRAGLMADPTFSSLYAVHRAGDEIQATLSYRYAGSRVPIQGAETRSFGVWLASAAGPEEPFGAAVDAMFSLMLADVPPGPAWLHEIAMVHYDYLSDKGQGWDRDLKLLAEWLKPEQRRRVALCLHGWYDAIGSYSYDSAAGRMKDRWLGFGPTQKIPLTPEDMKRRIRLARQLGFRVLLYFGDGLAADSGAAGYRDDWVYRDGKGQRIAGWQGPDTFGPTYWLNPAHPQVSAWFLGYMDALLNTFGAELDGFVWDETYECRLGQIAAQPAPAYCDRAMLALVKELSHRVHRFNPQAVFLASDCIGLSGMEDVPGYAMVAHGTYQDTGCQPAAWAYGLFPNWRNVLWSCNWACVSNFPAMRWGVETFGVPVAISNGWGDDRGPAEWTPAERDNFLQLFHKRLQRAARKRYLTEDPQALIRRELWPSAPGDPLPAPAPGAVNWAAAAKGGRATASSEERPNFPAGGVIDGVRNVSGWAAGHGWASGPGQPLPQWLQVDFGQVRTLNQLIVITYEHEDSTETATKWGIRDYEIQVWDTNAKDWKTVVSEKRGRAVKVRVHNLAQPVQSEKVRLLVTRVAPPDDRARLLQFEAWGPAANR